MYLFPTKFMKGRVFQLLYFYFKIIGLLTVQLNDFEFSRGTVPHFRVSIIGFIYNAVLIIVFSVLGYFSILTIYDSKYPNQSKTTEQIELLKASFGVFIVILLWIWLACKQKDLVKLANNFVNIDHVLVMDKFVENFESGVVKFMWLLVINVVIWIALCIADIIAFPEVPPLSLVSSVGPNFIFNWFLLLYSFNTISLQRKCQAINEAISRLSLKTMSLSVEQPEVTADKVIVRHFLILKNMHMTLQEIMTGISKFYAFPVLMVTTHLCGSIIYTSYYIAVPIIFAFIPLRPAVVFSSCCYLAMEFFPMTILTLSIEYIHRELKRTPEIIHKFLTQYNLNPKLKSELTLFSVELLHQNINFSACGIFSLNGTFLHSIVSMTLTHLIILIQFQSAYFTSPELLSS